MAFNEDGVCIDCIHFFINHDHSSMGVCNKMKQALQDQEFTKKDVTNDVVSTHGFCENFTNIHRIGVDGKVILPQLLPPYAKTRTDKKRRTFYRITSDKCGETCPAPSCRGRMVPVIK
jgi:hypothetical protein